MIIQCSVRCYVHSGEVVEVDWRAVVLSSLSTNPWHWGWPWAREMLKWLKWICWHAPAHCVRGFTVDSGGWIIQNIKQFSSGSNNDESLQTVCSIIGTVAHTVRSLSVFSTQPACQNGVLVSLHFCLIAGSLMIFSSRWCCLVVQKVRVIVCTK